MKTISAEKIYLTVKDLCLKANIILRPDFLKTLKSVLRLERNQKARKILQAIVENARIAGKEGLAICQDTGLPCVFLELGQDVRITGDLKQAINKGVKEGYKTGFFRESIIKEPLLRGRPAYTPAIIHIDIVKGSKLKVTVFPKGFGCENKTQLKMFNPTAGIDEIKKFIIETVRTAGADACPPYVVGVGIGGTADYSCFLAKKALLRDMSSHLSSIVRLERDLLKQINRLNIGPMGLGGKNTCLGVRIETFATHIAGLPVAVNINCHALRSATAVL